MPSYPASSFPNSHVVFEAILVELASVSACGLSAADLEERLTAR